MVLKKIVLHILYIVLVIFIFWDLLEVLFINLTSYIRWQAVSDAE